MLYTCGGISFPIGLFTYLSKRCAKQAQDSPTTPSASEKEDGSRGSGAQGIRHAPEMNSFMSEPNFSPRRHGSQAISKRPTFLQSPLYKEVIAGMDSSRWECSQPRDVNRVNEGAYGIRLQYWWIPKTIACLIFGKEKGGAYATPYMTGRQLIQTYRWIHVGWRLTFV